jgi:hypothetical protein
MMIPGQSSWSYGGVSIENVGGYAVLLPNDADEQRQSPVVVHVEVRPSLKGSICKCRIGFAQVESGAVRSVSVP